MVIMINLYNDYLLLSLVNITVAELKKKRQRALELKQFLLDNKVRLISFLHATRL